MKEIKITGGRLPKLFENIGGEPALKNILERFYAKMAQDVLIGFFFDDKDLDAIAAKQKEFLMRAWGVAPIYSGRSPRDAHAHLAPILSGHFDRRLVVLAETLREFKVSEEDIEVWLSFESKFRQAVQHD